MYQTPTSINKLTFRVMPSRFEATWAFGYTCIQAMMDT